MEQSHAARDAGETLLGELEISRIDIQANEGSRRAKTLRDPQRMSRAAKRAVDQGLARAGLERIKNLLNQYRLMTGGGEVHQQSNMYGLRSTYQSMIASACLQCVA